MLDPSATLIEDVDGFEIVEVNYSRLTFLQLKMGASPAKFLFGFLFVSIVLWLIFMFASRLLAWILSRVLGASVGFRVGGWKCLRDVVVKFKKGAVESISVGEIRLSLRQSLVKLGVGFISRDPKLQVLICDLEVVMRVSKKSTQKTKSKKTPHFR
ncbi:RNA pol II promoter Fmp27 protein domain [Abeliophyllum distichum]|uniref:RNA pol II promoter Fmp27 protein domain n=1 Tax=Abeliophyllum distichum TaxID=126358 RepID=A0ABD1T036_9LAMI